MVKLAPPAFVVAMVASVVWIPLALCRSFLDLPLISAQYVALSTAITLGATLATVGAVTELARRNRDGPRALLAIAAGAMLLALVGSMGGGFIAIRYFKEVPYELWVNVLQWGTAVLWLIAWLAFACAGWRAQRRTAIAMLVFAVVLGNLPPVRDYLHAAFGQWVLFLLFVIVAPVRNVIATLLAGAIAKRAHEPAHDHLAAARNAKLIALAIATLAAIQLATAASARLVSEEVDVRFGFTLAELLGTGLLAVALWRLAQNQLPALPRYRVHVAAVGAVYSAGMLIETFTYTSQGASWQMSSGALHVAWWHLAPATLALACLVTILLTYAKHRDAVYSPALVGGALFIAGVAGWFILSDHAIISPVSLACGYLALVPAVLRASRELSTDRVQTTADVFA